MLTNEEIIKQAEAFRKQRAAAAKSKGKPLEPHGQLVIYEDGQGNLTRIQVRDGSPLSREEMMQNAVVPTRPAKPDYVLTALAEMQSADEAFKEAHDRWCKAQDERDARGKKLRLKKKTDPALAVENERIAAALSEREAAGEVQLEKRIAHQKATSRWGMERQFAKLEENRRKLEEAKANELAGRRRILFGWRDKLKRASHKEKGSNGK